MANDKRSEQTEEHRKTWTESYQPRRTNTTMETSFWESTQKPPKSPHELITRIIRKQLDIKLGQFTLEELDSVLRKIKNRKAAGLEIPPEVQKTR